MTMRAAAPHWAFVSALSKKIVHRALVLFVVLGYDPQWKQTVALDVRESRVGAAIAAAGQLPRR